MQQITLPFHKNRLHTFLKVLLVVVSVSLLLAIAVYTYLTYTKDNLVRYFPKDTEFFIALRVTPTHLESPFFERLDFSPELRTHIETLILNDLEQTAERNMGVGVVDGSVVVVMHMRHDIPDTHPFFSFLQKDGIQVFKITSKWSGQTFLVMSREGIALDRIKEVVSSNTAGLEQNLTLTLGRHTLDPHKGIVYIESTFLKHLEFLNEVPYTLPSFALSFEVTGAHISASSSGYPVDTKLYLPKGMPVQYGMFIHNPGKKYLELVKNEGLQEAFEAFDRMHGIQLGRLLREYSVNSIRFFSGQEHAIMMDVEASETGALEEDLRTTLLAYLQHIHAGLETRVLPDKTNIQVIAINDRDITLDAGRVVNARTDVAYRFAQDGEVVRVYSQLDEVAFDETPCEVSSKAEYVILGSEPLSRVPVLDQLAESIMISTYPHTYPQLMLCIQ